MDSKLLLALMAGKVPDVCVGRLSPHAASLLKTHTVEVRLGKAELDHIVERHPDMIPDDILLIDNAIRDGMIAVDKRKPNFLTICYQGSAPQSRRYILALKFTSGRHELWVSTFFRANPRQTKRVLGKCRLVRAHAQS